MEAMYGEPTEKQLAYLRRLKYEGPPPATKREASLFIDAIKTGQAKAKESGKTFKGLTPSQAERLREKSNRTWLKERRKEVREQVRDDLSGQRELERDLRRYGGVDRGDSFAGWLLRIGPQCVDSKHLNGLLVTVDDAKADPGLLPPYDTCREGTCECDIEPVSGREVPKGTRIAERADDSAGAPSGKRVGTGPGMPRKSGCMSVVVALAVVIAALYVIFAH